MSPETRHYRLHKTLKTVSIPSPTILTRPRFSRPRPAITPCPGRRIGARTAMNNGSSTNGTALPPTLSSTFDFMRVEWRFLLFGMAMAACSSLGHTFFI